MKKKPYPGRRFVPYYDAASNTTTQIPKEELSPGVVAITLTGCPGIMYAKASDFKLSMSYRHPPFNKDVRAILSTLAKDLAEVYPQSLKKWENGFRKDAHPEREIAIWTHMAEVFKSLAAQFALDRPGRLELFKALVTCSTAEPSTVREMLPPDLSLSWEIVNLVIRRFYEGPPEGQGDVEIK